MDKARLGYHVDSLTASESRRLENEKILVEYLNALKPRWVIEEKIKTEKADSMFEIYLLMELDNIVMDKFQPSMFFKVQHDVSGFDL